jgi:hypothetical protein
MRESLGEMVDAAVLSWLLEYQFNNNRVALANTGERR